MKKFAISLILGAFLLSSSGNANAEPQYWSSELTPYLWMAGISGTASAGRATGADVDVSFGDIMDNLNFALMGRYEAQNSNGWGWYVDAMKLNLEADKSGPNGVLDAEIDLTMFEVMGTWRAGQTDLGFIDVMGGFRYWADLDLTLTIDPAALPGSAILASSNDWVDIVVGAKGIRHLNEKWDLTWHADIGGAGTNSAITSQLALGALYEISDKLVLDMQYRALLVDFEDGVRGTPGYFEYDTTTKGPQVGLTFRW